MRTSPGGIKLPKWNRENWIERDSGAYKCPNCGKIFWLITNPTPNTIGGTKQMQAHQRSCWD